MRRSVSGMVIAILVAGVMISTAIVFAPFIQAGLIGLLALLDAPAPTAVRQEPPRFPVPAADPLSRPSEWSPSVGPAPWAPSPPSSYALRPPPPAGRYFPPPPATIRAPLSPPRLLPAPARRIWPPRRFWQPMN